MWLLSMSDVYRLLAGHPYIPLLPTLIRPVDVRCPRTRGDRPFEADGEYYDLDQALKQNPLPHPEYRNDVCRCDYLPVIDKENSNHI